MKHLIVFYDDPCIFCNFWVKKLCKWDYKDQLRFSSLDSKHAIEFAHLREINLIELNSIIAWDQDQSYAYEAQAVFMILNRLGGLWKFFLIVELLPNFFTNFIYRIIANNRYTLFGRNNNCPMPDSANMHKFLN